MLHWRAVSSPGRSLSDPFPAMVIFPFLLAALTFASPLPFDNAEMRIRIPGDIIFGGIFPMHEASKGKCGAIKEEKGIQRLEAMLFAIDLINKDPKILPNITLGALILDSCSTETYALEQSMEFVKPFMNQMAPTLSLEVLLTLKPLHIRQFKFKTSATWSLVLMIQQPGGFYRDMTEYFCESGVKPRHKPHKRVAGVIGASFSGVSIMVANILRLFKIPQLSYASTSTELSDKSRFEYFSRVVPPDNFQAQAMLEIVKKLGWKYVSTVAVEGDYGEKGIASFVALAHRAGICVATSEKILRQAKAIDFDKIIERLLSKPNANGVIMFVDEDNTRKILQASIRANKSDKFHWIGSDSWGAKHYPVRDQEFAAEGAITILPQRNNLPEFDAYFRSLRPAMKWHCNESSGSNYREDEYEINCRNIWFHEFWSQHHKCVFHKNKKRSAHKNVSLCSGRESIQDYEEEGLVPFVVDAVYALAHAVHNQLKDECGEPVHLCEAMKPVPSGPELLRYIRDVTFVGLQGQEVKFNEDGDAYGSYTIFQYQKLREEKYDYVRIGTWKERLSFELWKTRWKRGNKEENRTSAPPRSICSFPCPNGFIRNFQDQCCWSCVACRENAYSFNDTCVACRPGFAPNQNRTDCFKIKATSISWTNVWAMVPLIFSGFGMALTVFTTIIFLKYNSTPVIMASGRELCYVLLFGILICYAMPLVVLAVPSVINCTLIRLGLGLSLSICYSSILTKTNRISRIFNRETKTVKRPVCTSPTSQIAITMGIVSCQFTGAVIWLAIVPPSVKEIYPTPNTAVITCGVSTFSLMMSLVFNMVLILLCTLYAFKTRKIPENFNEAKYIGFTMYSTCIVWLAFVPIYFGTNNEYKIQIASMCMCINISATVALGCLFSPKLYIVLFQPSKNVRQSTMILGARPGCSTKYTAAPTQVDSSLAPTSVVAVTAITSSSASTSSAITLYATTEARETLIA